MTDEQLIKKMQELPIVGQDYPCYQHNRIKKDYRDIVIINKIVPFNEADKRTLKEWNEMIKERTDLFAQETDYFIYGEIPKYKDYDEDEEDYWYRRSFCVYVRSDDNTWESLTDAGGLLDVTGGFLRKFEDSFLMSREQIEERWGKTNKLNEPTDFAFCNLKQIYEELMAEQEEIISSPIRFNGVHIQKIQDIFSKYGIDTALNF